ncbi:MAG: hypothetical protein H7832_10285 [Magnetococcus sp. DMHC-6]
MFDLLFVAGLLDQHASSFLIKRSATILNAVLPTWGQEGLTFTWVSLPEINGGCLLVRPLSARCHELLHAYVTSERAVFLFGRLKGCTTANHAQRLHHQWQENSVDSLRQSPGCFAAILVERALGRIHVLHDRGGRRALRYGISLGRIALSPHDLTLFSTDWFPLDYDPISVCSMPVFDWGMDGRGLLTSFRGLRPEQYLIWQQRHCTIRSDPVFAMDNHLHEKDEAALTALGEEYIETAFQVIREIVADAPRVHVDLTAGVDSRVLTALLIGALGKGRIHAECWGEEGSEVDLAQKVADSEGLFFKKVRAWDQKPSLTDFLKQLRFQAYGVNGCANGQLAVRHILEADSLPPHFLGIGGEIYRGTYYYNTLNQGGKIPGNDEIVAVILKKQSQSRHLPFLIPETLTNLHQRCAERIQEVAAFCPHPADIGDLFQVLELYQGFAIGEIRVQYYQERHSLFLDARLMAQAFRFPAPVGVWGMRLFSEIVRQFMPNGFNIETHPTSVDLNPRIPSRPTVQKKKSVQDFTKWLTHVGITRRHGELRADFFATEAETVMDLMTAQESLTPLAFHRSGVLKMLKQHRAGKWNFARMIGSCLTMESWRLLATQMQSGLHGQGHGWREPVINGFDATDLKE